MIKSAMVQRTVGTQTWFILKIAIDKWSFDVEVLVIVVACQRVHSGPGLRADCMLAG